MSWNPMCIDGLWWVGPGNMKGIGFKGWHNEYILTWWILFGCVIMFVQCQCVIPWSL